MRLSKKSAHRIIVSLGLIAPIVYLFGSLFFGLNGAHGEDVFAMPVTDTSYSTVSFVDNRWISYANGGYTPLANYTSSEDITFPANTFSFEYSVSGNTDNSPLFRVYYYSDTSFLGYNEYLSRSGTAPMWSDCTYIRLGYRLGSNISCAVTFSFYADNQLSGHYSSDIFSTMFMENNFLQKWGENTLSDSPVGFAPFATFIKFFDSSLIHGAGSQIALMMYGQLYYMLHIMLFDLVYHVLVFIPNLITSVFNKFGGGLNDE